MQTKSDKKYTAKKPVYSFIKRIFDIIVSFIAICILFVPGLVIAFIIKVTSKGHSVFADKRIGKNGKEIGVLKFRTMYYDAETNIHNYLTDEQIKSWEDERKLENDPRVTRFGKFLRKFSIDEIPQFINILFGSLSFVGPRPITKSEWDSHFTNEEKDRILQVKPGLTGYWQVYGRNNAEYKTHERQDLELAYCNKRCLWLDTKIFILTVPAVLKHKGVK